MKTRVLLYIILALVVAHPALAQRGDKAYPVDAATMQKYPELTKEELTPIKAAQLDLKGEFLEDTVTVFNLIHNVDRYAYEVLQKGTFVYVDKDRNVRYKGDCANRIEKANNCQKCLEIIAALRADSIVNAMTRNAIALAKEASASKSWLARTFDGLWDFLKVLGMLAVIAALFVLLMLLAIWFADWLGSRFSRGNTPPVAPAPVPAVPVPAPIAPAPVAPIVPVPVPTPAPTPAPAIILPTRHEIHLFYEGGAHIVLPSSRT